MPNYYNLHKQLSILLALLSITSVQCKKDFNITNLNFSKIRLAIPVSSEQPPILLKKGGISGKTSNYLIFSEDYLYSLPINTFFSPGITKVFSTKLTKDSKYWITVRGNLQLIVCERLGSCFSAYFDIGKMRRRSRLMYGMSVGIITIFDEPRSTVSVWIESYLSSALSINIGVSFVPRSDRFRSAVADNEKSYVDNLGSYLEFFSFNKEESIVLASKLSMRDGRFLRSNLYLIHFGLKVDLLL